jgi:hypothetical protein
VWLDNYRMSRAQEEFLRTTCEELLEKGFLRRVDSPWNSPVVLVPKKDTFRFTVNYRPTVNAHTANDDFPLPLIRPTLQELACYRWFAKLDLSNGYWNLPTSDAATQLLLAFTCPGIGQLTWTVLPQGLKQAPSIFQRLMTRLVGHLPFVRVYLDDIAIAANTLEELRARVSHVHRILRENNLPLNKDKCVEEATELKLLGFILSHNSVQPDLTVAKTLAAEQPPTTKRELRRFLGKFSHIAVHYPGTQSARATLFSALNNRKSATNVHLRGDTLSAFRSVQSALGNPTALNAFDARSREPVTVTGDAGTSGYAAIAKQGDRVVGMISRKYTLKSLPTSASTQREAFCMREALLAFQDILINREFVYQTDSQALASPAIFKSANPFIRRSVDRVSHLLSHGVIRWVRRDSAMLKLVDALGRDPDAKSVPTFRSPGKRPEVRWNSVRRIRQATGVRVVRLVKKQLVPLQK